MSDKLNEPHLDELANHYKQSIVDLNHEAPGGWLTPYEHTNLDNLYTGILNNINWVKTYGRDFTPPISVTKSRVNQDRFTGNTDRPGTKITYSNSPHLSAAMSRLYPAYKAITDALDIDEETNQPNNDSCIALGGGLTIPGYFDFNRNEHRRTNPQRAVGDTLDRQLEAMYRYHANPEGPGSTGERPMNIDRLVRTNCKNGLCNQCAIDPEHGAEFHQALRGALREQSFDDPGSEISPLLVPLHINNLIHISRSWAHHLRDLGSTEATKRSPLWIGDGDGHGKMALFLDASAQELHNAAHQDFEESDGRGGFTVGPQSLKHVAMHAPDGRPLPKEQPADVTFHGGAAPYYKAWNV